MQLQRTFSCSRTLILKCEKLISFSESNAKTKLKLTSIISTLVFAIGSTKHQSNKTKYNTNLHCSSLVKMVFPCSSVLFFVRHPWCQIMRFCWCSIYSWRGSNQSDFLVSCCLRIGAVHNLVPNLRNILTFLSYCYECPPVLIRCS